MGKKKAPETGVIRIPSEDLPSQKDGWVEMHAYVKTLHLPYFQGLDLEALQKALEREVSPFDEEYEALIERKERAMWIVYRMLSVFILDWNWTYPGGAPYPGPYRNIEAIEIVRPDEFEWLFDKLGKIIGEEELTIPKSNDTPS